MPTRRPRTVTRPGRVPLSGPPGADPGAAAGAAQRAAAGGQRATPSTSIFTSARPPSTRTSAAPPVSTFTHTMLVVVAPAAIVRLGSTVTVEPHERIRNRPAPPA